MSKLIDVHYQTLTLPPPYSYAYDLRIVPGTQETEVRLTWHYTDRDELTEEDILEEGFTPDDDFRWQGMLPQVWIPVVDRLLDTTQLVPEATATARDSLLTVIVTDTQGTTRTGTPNNFQHWEYRLQELVQAVYEASRREHPLRIRYLDYRPTGSLAKATLEASFMHRRFTIMLEQATKTTTQEAPWQQLSSLLEVLYLPDYHSEQSLMAQPRKQGQYVDPGDGRWYQLGHAVTNPGKKDVISIVAKQLTALSQQTAL